MPGVAYADALELQDLLWPSVGSHELLRLKAQGLDHLRLEHLIGDPRLHGCLRPEPGGRRPLRDLHDALDGPPVVI